MKVVYHKDDLDGLCAAAQLLHCDKYTLSQEDFIGMSYGQELPTQKIEEGEKLILADFCLEPFNKMEELAEENEVLIIDHHRTTVNNKNRASNTLELFVSEEYSGCELVWMWLHPGRLVDEAQAVVLDLGRYDCWRDTDMASWNDIILPFQYGMRTRVDSFSDQVWYNLLKGSIEFQCDLLHEITEEGEYILRYVDSQNEKEIEAMGHQVEFHGNKCLAINGTIAHNSKVFEAHPDSHEFDIFMNYYWERSHWTIVLYSDTIDVSALAEEYAGGGHKGAAGFQCSELPFDLK